MGHRGLLYAQTRENKALDCGRCWSDSGRAVEVDGGEDVGGGGQPTPRHVAWHTRPQPRRPALVETAFLPQECAFCLYGGDVVDCRVLVAARPQLTRFDDVYFCASFAPPSSAKRHQALHTKSDPDNQHHLTTTLPPCLLPRSLRRLARPSLPAPASPSPRRHSRRFLLTPRPPRSTAAPHDPHPPPTTAVLLSGPHPGLTGRPMSVLASGCLLMRSRFSAWNVATPRLSWAGSSCTLAARRGGSASILSAKK